MAISGYRAETLRGMYGYDVVNTGLKFANHGLVAQLASATSENVNTPADMVGSKTEFAKIRVDLVNKLSPEYEKDIRKSTTKVEQSTKTRKVKTEEVEQFEQVIESEGLSI